MSKLLERHVTWSVTKLDRNDPANNRAAYLVTVSTKLLKDTFEERNTSYLRLTQQELLGLANDMIAKV